MTLLTTALMLLIGCAQGPTFDGIRAVTIHHQTAGGTSKQVLTAEKLDQASKCLYTTQEIGQEQAGGDLLQTIYLVEVQDRRGDRMFELFSMSNMKGNKGKYYDNRCIYKLIKSL